MNSVNIVSPNGQIYRTPRRRQRSRRRGKRNTGPQRRKPRSRKARARAAAKVPLGIPATAQYAAALLNPCNPKAQGAKVPDMESLPSATATVRTSGLITTNDVGAGAVAFTGSLTDWLATANMDPGFNTVNTWTLSSSDQTGTLATLAESFRPVAACMDVEFIGSTMNDQGTLTSALYPVGDYTWTDLGVWPTHANSTVTTPLRQGAKALWRPQDNSSWAYQTLTNSGLSASTTEVKALNTPMVGVAITGAQPSTTVARYILTFLLEYLPNVESISLVDSKPSPVDIEGASRVVGGISKIPVSHPLDAVSGMAGHVINELAGNFQQFSPYKSKAVPYVEMGGSPLGQSSPFGVGGGYLGGLNSLAAVAAMSLGMLGKGRPLQGINSLG